MGLSFKSGDVTLRPLTVDDAEITLKWRNSDRARHLKRGAQTLWDQARWIDAREKDGDLNFVIEYRGEPVGMIGITGIDQTHKHCELGRELIGERDKVGTVPVAWVTEILLCDYIFDTLGLHLIHGDVMIENTGMIKTREYLGYHRDGVLRDFYVYDGVFKDTVLLSLMDREYWGVCRPKLSQLVGFCS